MKHGETGTAAVCYLGHEFKRAAIEGGRKICEGALRDRPVYGQAKSQALAGASALVGLQLSEIEQSLRSSL